MLPKISKFASFELVETGFDRLGETLPMVLKDFSTETIESIAEAISDSVERQGMRFVSALALTVVAANKPLNGVHELAAAYLMEYPGKLASLVGPWMSSDAPYAQSLEAAKEVLRKLTRTAFQWDAEIVQAVVEEDSVFSREALQSSGFTRLATLYQMTLDCSNAFAAASNLFSGEPKNLDGRLENKADILVWRKYDASDYDAWIEWMDATYEATTDCPELNGVRTTSETFSGYWASSGVKPGGLDSPEWWAAFESSPSSSEGTKTSSKIASAFMLGSTSLGLWELSYMGVAPKYRSRKIGRMTLEKVLHRSQTLAAKQLWLAVDHRNTNAIQLYEQFGFERTRQLEAWFLSLKQEKSHNRF